MWCSSCCHSYCLCTYNILQNKTSVPLRVIKLKTFFLVTLQEKLLDKTEVKPKERSGYVAGSPVATVVVLNLATFLMKDQVSSGA